MADHREVIREAFGRYGGYEVDNQGDSFFYAFATATGAVGAVKEAMAALDGGPIAVRVGVHTGEPGLDPPKYVGLDVHTAARIMAVGHGGQVVPVRAATCSTIRSRCRTLASIASRISPVRGGSTSWGPAGSRR